MILGRPTNLILGAFTALFNVAVMVLGTQGVAIPPEIVGAVNLAFAAVIAVVAYQPPTLNVGDTFTTVTPAGQPNVVTTVPMPSPAP